MKTKDCVRNICRKEEKKYVGTSHVQVNETSGETESFNSDGSVTSSDTKGINIYDTKLNKLSGRIPVINKKRDSVNYSKPTYINDSLIVCSSGYELLTFNLKTREARVIFKLAHSPARCITFVKSLNRIFFANENDTSGDIYSINLEGKDLRKTAIRLAK